MNNDFCTLLSRYREMKIIFDTDINNLNIEEFRQTIAELLDIVEKNEVTDMFELLGILPDNVDKVVHEYDSIT